MKSSFLLTFALSLLSPSLSVQNKVKLACYEEEGTRKTFCIDEHNVRVNGPVRASAFYTGGPKGVDKSPYIIVTNCLTHITTLQDNKGVNFGGGFDNSTPQAEALSQWLCDTKHQYLRKDVTLKQ